MRFTGIGHWLSIFADLVLLIDAVTRGEPASRTDALGKPLQNHCFVKATKEQIHPEFNV